MLISIIALKYQNMSDFLDSIWSELGEASLNSIQENFNCCGFSSPSDRSQQPCPSGVTTGCKNPLLNATRDFILYFLIATVFIFLLQGILLWRGIKLKRRM